MAWRRSRNLPDRTAQLVDRQILTDVLRP